MGVEIGSVLFALKRSKNGSVLLTLWEGCNNSCRSVTQECGSDDTNQ